MQNTLEALEWRYATKQFDSTKKLSEEEISLVTKAMRLAPVSFGLQTWKAIIVTNDEVRATLREAAYDQPQITDASHLIVLAVRKTIDDALVDEYISKVAEVRGMDLEALAGYAGMIKGFISYKDDAARREWAARQAYIVLGFALETAALHNIDACPMEGFDPKQFDEILGLEAQGLESKVVFTLGNRSSEDQTATWAKVRLPEEALFMHAV